MNSEKRCPSTVGFRLEQTEGSLLLKRAQSLGVSVHELARHYVQLALSEKEREGQIQAAIVGLQKEILELRRDVATSAEALLSAAGKVEPEDARTWIDENLRIG